MLRRLTDLALEPARIHEAEIEISEGPESPPSAAFR
jgi:hypothetical protein